jgi:hypothetical protein
MHSAHNSVKIITLHSNARGKSIGSLKAYAVYLVAKPVRIFLCHVDRRASPALLDAKKALK